MKIQKNEPFKSSINRNNQASNTKPSSKKPDFQKAYNILMDYFDYIPEEEKQEVNQKLKECGL